MMNIVIFGLGGVGGLVGGVLARHHRDTYFYVRGDNLAAILKDGIKITSPSLGDFSARPKLASDDAGAIGIADVLIIASKGYDIGAVCAAAAPMVGSHTLVIPLLNGIGVSAQMERCLPPCVLADGLIRVLSHLEKPGHVYHQAGGHIVVGMRDASRPAALDEVVSILRASGISANISDDIVLDCWKKYVSVCGNGMAYCWFDAATGAVRQTPGYEDVLRGIWGELVSVAQAKGIALPDSTIEENVKAFSASAPETITSLYRDLQSGKPTEKTELAHLVGSMVQFGKETGIPTPYHQAVLDKYSR